MLANIKKSYEYCLTLDFVIFLYHILYDSVYLYLISFRLLNNLILFTKLDKLFIVVFFLHKNSYVKVNSLLDITVVDRPLDCLHRYEVSYILLNHKYNYRFIVRIFVDGITPIISLSSIFNSSN